MEFNRGKKFKEEIVNSGKYYRKFKQENRKVFVGFIYKEVFVDFGESEYGGVLEVKVDYCGLLNKRVVRTYK